MISMQYNDFILACKKEADRRNDEFGDQGVNYSVIYPFEVPKLNIKTLCLQCDYIKPGTKKGRHSQVTMSEDEFNKNTDVKVSGGWDINTLVNMTFDLVTNKARGDLMI